MAKKRDVVIAVIIIMFFVIAIGMFGLMFIGLASQDDGLEFGGFGDKVGVVEVFGIINEPLGRKVIAQIDKWTDNNSIKAVVIHVNSPGGGVAISQEIYDAISRLSEEKPVVTGMASVAASGGYYIACASDRIVANPGSLVGSIGVVLQFHTFAELLEKIGIGTEIVKSGEMKDVGSYTRSMTEKEDLMLRSVVMDSYEQFVEAIAKGRNMEKEDIYPLADGSIFTGLQAYNLGLVDTLGGLTEAIEIAAELAGLDGEPNVVRPYERKKLSPLDLLGGLFGWAASSVGSEFEGPQLMYLAR